MMNTKNNFKRKFADSQEESAARQTTKRRRLGGRSQHVQAAVFAATIDVLLNNGYEGFRIADVAERAGVNPTSIYRRWGIKEALITEALLSRVQEELPIPDTGTLRSDLIVFLANLATFLQSPLGSAMLQIIALAIHRSDLTSYRMAYWMGRVSHVKAVFERAAGRGEIPAMLDTTLTLELLAGPIYVRTLFTGQPLDQALIEKIVDVVLDGMA